MRAAEKEKHVDTSLSFDGQQLIDEFVRLAEEATTGLTVPFRDSMQPVRGAFDALNRLIVDGSWIDLVTEGTGLDEEVPVLAGIVERVARVRPTPPAALPEEFAIRRLLVALGETERANDPAPISGSLAVAIMDDPTTTFAMAHWVGHRYHLTREGSELILRDASLDAVAETPLDQPDRTRPIYALRPGAENDGEVIARVDPQVAARYAYELVLLEAAEMLGAATALFDATVIHLNTRQQFGVPLASFQALNHRVVDLFAQIETLRSLVEYAAWVADARPDALQDFALMAKGYGARTSWETGSEAIQLHGAMGYTWEQGLQIPFGRAMVRSLSSPSGAESLRIVGQRTVDRGALIELLD